MDEAGVSLRRNTLKFNEKLCVVCQKGGKLTSGINGCRKVRWAACERKDIVFERLQMISSDSLFFYHMTNECYRTYTMKTKIERAIKKIEDPEPENLESDVEIGEQSSCNRDRYARSKVKSRNVSSVIKDEKFPCVICGKIGLGKHCSTTYRICERDRAQKLLSITAFLKDEVFTRIADLRTIDSVFAADIYYHKNCMRSYEKKYERLTFENVLKEPSTSSLDCNNFKVQRNNAISMVVNTLTPRLKFGDAFTLTEVCLEVNKILPPNMSVKNIDIKKYLVANFGEEINFSVPTEANKPTIFFHSSVSIEEVVEVLRSKNVIKESAKIIKESLMEVNFNLENQFSDENNLRQSWDEIQIPSPLLSFFSELFNFSETQFQGNQADSDSEDDEPLNIEAPPKSISKNKVLKMKSLFQIIYFMMHGGKKRTPLHVMTGLTVHAVCKSSALIKSLNRTGISISYDEVLRCRTSLASFAVEMCKSIVPLPSHFDPSKFTTAAFDNFDHEEATDSGLNGTHDTVAVLFPEKSSEVIKKPNISDTNVRYSNRPFHNSLQCQQLKDFYKIPGPIFLPEIFAEAKKNITLESYFDLRADDAAWFLCRMDISEEQLNILKAPQTVPSWLAFNSVLTKDDRIKQSVGFLPILPYPVTDYSTVYTALCNFKDILHQLQQTSLAVFCDEGVYHIARHIKFLRNKEFENITLMLGSFHVIKVVLACVGKYLRGSGIEHVFVESGAFGINTVEQVLNGSNYARSVKGLFMLSEVLQRLQFEAFFTEHDLSTYEQEIISLQNLQDTFLERNLEEAYTVYSNFQENSNNLLADFKKFIRKRCEESDLFKYWNNVLVLIRLVRNLIRADRTADWNLHLDTVEQLQPIFHVMDCTNYARWSSVYLHDMLLLEKTTPELFSKFMEGQFVVKQSNMPFTSVGTDQALEQTINRSKKSSSGIIGSTRKKDFVAAWDLVYHEILAISNLHREKTFVQNDNYELKTHHEYQTGKTDRTEALIQKMVKFITKILNPFKEGNQQLRNIVTQECPSSETTKELLDVFKTGCQVYETFQKERFQEFSKPISQCISRVKLPPFKTLASGVKQKQSKACRKQNYEYRRIFDLARERNYDIKSLLSFELTYENILFEQEDVLKKEPNKSSILEELYKTIGDEDFTLSGNNDKFCLMVDVMMGLRKLNWKNLKTFKDLATEFCNLISRTLKGRLNRVDFVFDSYLELSPKAGERIRRYNDECICVHEITEDIPLPVQEKKFWGSTENKILLQSFLRSFILKNGFKFWPGVQLICSATNTESFQSTLSSSKFLNMLEKKEIEEADMRIMVHIAQAVRDGHERICILSSDTDIIIMSLYHLRTFEATGLKELWIKAGTGARKRDIPLHVMASRCGTETCSVLPALYHLTGADYTSKVGTKRAALHAEPEKYLLNFALGLSESEIESSVRLAEEFLVKVYRKDNSFKTFNDLRYWTYHHQKNVSLEKLPPTSANIRFHILRAFYIVYNQNHCLERTQTVLDPLVFGYKIENGCLSPKSETNLFPPTEELVPSCNCSKCARQNSCGCRGAGLKCCSFCNCQTLNQCTNPYND